MTTESLYEQHLLREYDLRHRIEVAGLNRKKAETALAEAESEVSGFSKLLPFLGREQKAAVQSASSRLEHWKTKENTYEADHAESEKQLDVITLTKIREDGADEYWSR